MFSSLYTFEQVSALGFLHSSTCACPLTTRMPWRHLKLSMVSLELIIYSPVVQATSLRVTLDPPLSIETSLLTPYGSLSTSCWFHLPNIFSSLIICASVAIARVCYRLLSLYSLPPDLSLPKLLPVSTIIVKHKLSSPNTKLFFSSVII